MKLNSFIFSDGTARKLARVIIAGAFFVCLGPASPGSVLPVVPPPTTPHAVAFNLKDVDPSGVVYAEDGMFKVKINLERVTQVPTHLDLRVNRGPALPLDLISNENPQFTYGITNDMGGKNACCVLDTNKSQLTLSISDGLYKGKLKIAVGNGGGFSNSIETTFACCSPETPRIIAIIIAVVLMMIPVVMIGASGGTAFGVAEPQKPALRWLAALILDRETATYSLSKFQLYLWLFVSIVSYVYFILAMMLIQGSLEFCDIPKNLPTLFLVSAGTPVAALFITNARGPKGAGDPKPSLADLVSCGGVAAADRFQLFVWTLLGSAYFLFLTLSIDPAAIKDLPAIPQRMIDIMGLSAGGYLAGKFARRPGPVIDDIGAAVPGDGSLTLTVRGRILSEAADFKIDDDDVGAACFQNMNYRPVIQEREDETKPDVTGKILILTIAKPSGKWKTQGDHMFTISNPDGQKASWPFNIKP